MKLLFAYIAPKRARSKTPEIETLTSDYIQRISRYLPCETHSFLDENSLFSWTNEAKRRTSPYVVLLDSAGKSFASKDFAAFIGRQRDDGLQQLVLAIGPSDGWSQSARAQADFLLSFGPMTLPHELVRIVLAEQVYRALTILSGHPYHHGH